jgi:DNA-binding ferritin-like protein
MTTSSLTDIFQSASEAPTQELLTEEVVVTKEATPDNLIYQMVSFSSYLYQLNIQAHLLHLNIECSSFLALHKFLKKQYQQHTEDFDMLAEYVRSMDYLMPMCKCGLMDAYKDFSSVESYDAKESLTLYTKNLEAGGMMGKDLVETARMTGAPDIENYAAEICGHLFKGAWMLKATLRSTM